ncbi:hypothetical protein PT201_08185 [Erysipelothrix rhusiopathiae]|nr:hypothetical protein [Erysipelothrix rhusiopathiae]
MTYDYYKKIFKDKAFYCLKEIYRGESGYFVFIIIGLIIFFKFMLYLASPDTGSRILNWIVALLFVYWVVRATYLIVCCLSFLLLHKKIDPYIDLTENDILRINELSLKSNLKNKKEVYIITKMIISSLENQEFLKSIEKTNEIHKLKKEENDKKIEENTSTITDILNKK